MRCHVMYTKVTFDARAGGMDEKTRYFGTKHGKN